MMQVGDDDLNQCEEVVDWFDRQSMLGGCEQKEDHNEQSQFERSPVQA